MAGGTGTMLGAELGGLSELSAQMMRTSQGIGVSRESAQAIADQVVAELEATFAAAMSRITQTTDDLTATVNAAQGQTDVTVWTGANATQFTAAGRDFTANMSTIVGATQDAYNGFQTAMDGVRGHIVEYQTTLRQNLTGAEEATTSMAQAVDAQFAALDAAMNSGVVA